MKSIFAASLVILALLIVFQKDIGATLFRTVGVVARTSISNLLPFEWQHAYAKSAIDELSQQRERVRYQWAASHLEKEQLEARIQGLHRSLLASQTRLEKALEAQDLNQDQIASKVQRHDRHFKAWQDSKDHLNALNATLQELEGGEQKLSQEIQSLDHRLHMVRLQHVDHSTKRIMMERTSSHGIPSSLRVLENLETQEQIESIYLDRFSGNQPDTTHSSLMERAREIVGLSHLDS